MKLAVIADIHGNLPALEAVVADFRPEAPDYVVLAGDLINATPFSVEVLAYVMDADWLVIRGNHEFYYLDYGTNRMHPQVSDPDRWRALHALQRDIPEAMGRYLATLPDDLTLQWLGCEPLRVVHGMPGDARAGLFPRMPDADAAALLQGVAQHTVITAHTHMPLERRLARRRDAPSPRSPNPPFKAEELRADYWHVINPGSVGLSVNGCADAHYALLHSVADAPESEGWRAEFRRVPYDRARTLHAFHDRGYLEAGGPINEMFYWEILSAEPEISHFFAWARAQGFDPQRELDAAFDRYKRVTQRGRLMERLDPTARYRAGGETGTALARSVATTGM